MAIKITLIGDKSVLAGFDRKVNQLKREKEYIFYDPLQPIVNEIRKNLVTDTFNPTFNEKKNHIFTGDLFSNTRKEIVSKNNPDGFTMDMGFGYFSDHGETLELGSDPHSEPLFKMEAWAAAKHPEMSEAAQVALAMKIKKQLEEEGSEPRPIIMPVWEDKKGSYFNEVKNRLEKVWNR